MPRVFHPWNAFDIFIPNITDFYEIVISRVYSIHSHTRGNKILPRLDSVEQRWRDKFRDRWTGVRRRREIKMENICSQQQRSPFFLFFSCRSIHYRVQRVTRALSFICNIIRLPTLRRIDSPAYVFEARWLIGIQRIRYGGNFNDYNDEPSSYLPIPSVADYVESEIQLLFLITIAPRMCLPVAYHRRPFPIPRFPPIFVYFCPSTRSTCSIYTAASPGCVGRTRPVVTPNAPCTRAKTRLQRCARRRRNIVPRIRGSNVFDETINRRRSRARLPLDRDWKFPIGRRASLRPNFLSALNSVLSVRRVPGNNRDSRSRYAT